jgi:uncharacterized protein YdeI (YjbR/CyaY-like superfamily)
MPEPDPSRTLPFSSPTELAQWLQTNHSTEQELWIKVYKKGSGTPSVTWNDIVVESLCWGWIDGIKKSLDDRAYLQRITPRRAKSVWSKRNREHVERLIKEGRMQETGLAHVHAAKEDGRWQNAYRTSEMEVPKDFLAALEKHPEAKQFYETLPKSNRYIIAHGLTSAKRPETRQRRFQKYLDLLKQGKRPNTI